MIERFRVQNYKALKDVTLDLTPIHVLIGPNDSGKTSILQAVATLYKSVEANLTQAIGANWEGADLVTYGAHEPVIQLGADVHLGPIPVSYDLYLAFREMGQHPYVKNEYLSEGGTVERFTEDLFTSWSSDDSQRTALSRLTRGSLREPRVPLVTRALQFRMLVNGVHSYRWNPALLALPNAPDTSRRFCMEKSGFGLTLCLDDLLGYDREQFGLLEAEFRQLFPYVRSLKLIPGLAFKAPIENTEVPALTRSDGKGLHFQFNDGSLVPASQVSDGLLLVLAYLAVLYSPHPPRMILIEEPENGVHPSRLRDVLHILRKLVGKQNYTQVVLTTHSPYVVDLFAPEEVTLCRKQEDGSVAVRRLSESETVRRQIDVFTLGEIWTAEGDEALAAPITEPLGSAA